MSKNVLKNRRHAFLEPKVCKCLYPSDKKCQVNIAEMNLYSWKRGNVDIFYFKEIKFEAKQ